jgi:hypothetical protein
MTTDASYLQASRFNVCLGRKVDHELATKIYAATPEIEFAYLPPNGQSTQKNRKEEPNYLAELYHFIFSDQVNKVR